MFKEKRSFWSFHVLDCYKIGKFQQILYVQSQKIEVSPLTIQDFLIRNEMLIEKVRDAITITIGGRGRFTWIGRVC